MPAKKKKALIGWLSAVPREREIEEEEEVLDYTDDNCAPHKKKERTDSFNLAQLKLEGRQLDYKS